MDNMNSNEKEIHVKGGFSERKGIKHFSDVVQIDSLNDRTRNKIYDALKNIFNKLEDAYINDYTENLQDCFAKYLYTEIFSKSERDIPKYGANYYYNEIWNEVYMILKKYDYIDVFTFIEGFFKFFEFADSVTYRRYEYKNKYIEDITYIFKSENVNYRIINDQIIDIIDENQIDSIQETINNPYKVVSEHYSKAIEQLYNVKDYANSIKESISTVEAMCQVINGSKETLGKTLSNLKIEIHPALKNAYSSLYGYTSDENGTRHANGIGEKRATFEEAKYMLISCSAFVNYLKENYEKEK